MIVRLVTLLALVLMPFGMGAAVAVPVHHPSTTAAAAAAQPCGEHGGQPAEPSRDEVMDCAVSCSMLAVAETQFDELPVGLPDLAVRALAERDAGLHPDTATPPPKLS